MSALVPAVGIDAIFTGKLKDGTTYQFSRPVLFWRDHDDKVTGVYLDDAGDLVAASGRSNFVRYHQSDVEPVVASVPVGDLYAVYREEDGSLWRQPVDALALRADGTMTAHAFQSDGMSGPPEDSGNFVGYWRKSWGDEPARWSAGTASLQAQGMLMDTHFTASGGSPPGK